MFIGVARFELFIPASASLKDKRQVLRPVLDGVRRRFTVAIAEIDHQDLWQRAALGVSCVSGTMSQCHKILQEVEKTIGRTAAGAGEIVDRDIEVVAWDDL
jgi:uncharacterized protein YlxP (DUF503 family)